MFGGAFAAQLMTQKMMEHKRLKPLIPAIDSHHLPPGYTVGLLGEIYPPAPKAAVAPSTMPTSTPPDAPGAPPPPMVPLTPKQIDAFVTSQNTAIALSYSANPAFVAGYKTGERAKEIAHNVKEALTDVSNKWDNWKGTLKELLADAKWVGYAIGAAIIGYVLFETFPVWSFVWDALMMVMRVLKQALHVLGWVWDGFVELMQEIWHSLAQLRK